MNRTFKQARKIADELEDRVSQLGISIGLNLEFHDISNIALFAAKEVRDKTPYFDAHTGEDDYQHKVYDLVVKILSGRINGRNDPF